MQDASCNRPIFGTSLEEVCFADLGNALPSRLRLLQALRCQDLGSKLTEKLSENLAFPVGSV